MSKSLLLIGGTGFLGSALRKTFADSPYTVTYTGTHANPGEENYLVLDLFKESDAAKVRDFDIVVNLTGQFVEPLSKCFALNTRGMWNLLQALKPGKQKLIQISTTLVYGTVPTATEDLPLDPEFPYAAGKATAEFLLQTSLPEDRFLIARLSNLYGEEQSKGLLWYILNCVQNGKTIAIADNNGELRRQFLHVEDAARIIHDLIEANATGTINVPGPETFTIKELVSLCERITGKTLTATYVTTPPRGNIDEISSEKLHSLIPVAYRHSVEDYLRRSLLH